MSAMLKSTGEMRVPSALSIMMCCLDVAFNYLFIYLLKMGVLGAALGTMSAYVVTVLPMAWQATCKNKIIALRLDRTPFVWMWSYVRNALKVSLPVAVQNILMGSAQVVSTLIVARWAMWPLPPTRLPLPPRASAICRDMVWAMPHQRWSDRPMVPVVAIFARALLISPLVWACWSWPSWVW